jgi:ATP-dependent Clp protease ATP-binding subunit ClpB
MSEFSNPDSISKLLGSSSQNQNEQSETTLLDRVKSNPYTVVLFDEIEKADKSVLDLFLQIFDEGRLTSSKGETVDFTNTIIICTSNIAANMVLESLETNQMWEETKNRVMIELKQAIRPELFNRFDGIVVFHPQNQEVLSKIADKLLEELYKRMHEKSIELDWDATIPMLIANKAYEPGFGARPIKRYIQEKVEGQIATMLINGELNAGDSLNIKESWIV